MKPILITIAFVAVFSCAKAQQPTDPPPVVKELPATDEHAVTTQQMVFGPGDTVLVYINVQQAPEPKGGMKGFYQYLATNIHYPVDSRNKGIQGKVFVSFIIEEDGSTSHVRVTRSVSDDIDAEAIRLLKNCPKWNPGIQDGKPVKVLYTFPISFRLQAGIKNL